MKSVEGKVRVVIDEMVVSVVVMRKRAYQFGIVTPKFGLFD